MTYRLSLLLVLLLTLLGVSPHVSQASPNQPPTAAYVPGEVLIKLAPGVQISAQAAVHGAATQQLGRSLTSMQAHSAELLGPGSATYRVRVDSQQPVPTLAAQLARLPGVLYAEPNYLRYAMRTPNDPAVREQWALTNIRAFEAWDITTGAGVPIAVLDTGVSSSHPDLSGKVLPGYNARSNSDRSEDDNGHGTAVAGLIAARTDNGEGIAGMCWDCPILPVKVLTARGVGNDATVAQGIRWAADAGARIINLSLGGTSDSQVLREAVRYAFERGALIVAASGNERQQGNAISYPAGYDEVLAVSGTGNTDTITGFSNTGAHVDIAAPSVGMWTTLIDGSYGPPNGTSFSSPYVAGAAGLVFTLRPDLSNLDVKCILEASADDQGAPGKDDEYGWGRLNTFAAVQLAQSYTGCPLAQPPIEPAPAPGPVPSDGNPFAPVPPVANDANLTYFPETQHTLRGTFKGYWERHGGLPIFGFPISEEFTELGDDGQPYTVQYFERHRFELHPQNAPPYNVQLSRLGDITLQEQGRVWFTFPKSQPTPGCLYFEATEQTLCEPFLSYWAANGLEFDGQPGKSFEESLALFGQPLSGPQLETIAPGVTVPVQWFERARFEDHGPNGVLLGLLSSELTTARGWR